MDWTLGGEPARALALTLTLTLAGCGGAGGSGGGFAVGASAGSTAPGTTAGPASSAGQQQWQTALAALAAAPDEQPGFDDPALDAYNDLIATSWPRLATEVQVMLGKALDKMLIGKGIGAVTVQAVRGFTLDASAAPGLLRSGSGTLQELGLALPKQGRWSLRFTADVGGQFPVNVLGFSTTVPLTIPIEVILEDLSIVQAVSFDLSDHRAPRLASSGKAKINMKLRVDSSAPVIGPLLGQLSGLIDSVIRPVLGLAPPFLQRILNVQLTKLPTTYAHGRGGPALQGATPRIPLEAYADQISNEIQTFHMPFDHVWPAIFDTPNSGGQVARYYDQGDSAIWTGHYLAGEAARFDQNGDSRALDGATRALRGFGLLFSVAIAGDGLLSRAAAPMSSPHAQPFVGTGGSFIRNLRGVPYVAKGDISRDQYVGAMMGLGQAWLRIPLLRPAAEELLSRAVNYLERVNWNPTKGNLKDISTSFVQAPSAVLAFTKMAATANPRRWNTLHQQMRPLAQILWLNAWASSREVHESYYKFNLGFSNLVSLIDFETNPDDYRGYLKQVRIMHDAVGHHQNAWFDAVYASAVPTEAGRVGPMVQKALERWTLRPRRGFSIRNSSDSSIEKVTVTLAVSSRNLSSSGAPTSVSMTVAKYPLPIEKRTHTDFLWQRSPFDLDGNADAKEQKPGIDLLLPYWFARNRGLIK